MAQLAISVATSAIKTFAKTLASSAISSLFADDQVVGAQLDKLHILQSTEGASMPMVFGRVRIGGQIIWADGPVENRERVQSGGKGGGQTTERKYTLSFAVGLCDGVIDGVGRIWADGALLDGSKTQFRLHTGADDQLADSLIQAHEGVGQTPAFKGLAYVVFEDFPLTEFGNRIPQLSFEVFRTPVSQADGGRLREQLRGVTLIPGSGEFAYATTPVLADLGPGVTRAENVNNSVGGPDILAALDDLQRTLPACDTISLVVSWFGDDLRCGECQIQPCVENKDKVTIGLYWAVGGVTRENAQLVSLIDERPAFGGTPSDQSILDAIAEIKARGFKVVFYPFVLMDVPPQNALADPYGASQQAAFPWRGRITCHPAPGQVGSPDKTIAVQSQVDAFFGIASPSDFTTTGNQVSYSGSSQWSYRRMILHYAKLCQIAGGVDAFLIGSELIGLTQLRSSNDIYPVVAKLEALAADVASILPQAKLSYGADWSEYFGHHPQDGSNDVYFHLDPLWANPHIDFVGIDWYAPLSDWRDGSAHLDAAIFDDLHDLAYLQSNVEGGEGYDWYYASDTDRDDQQRTPITDGSVGKPWTFRYKDIKNWWSHPHYNRPNGIEHATPTDWVAMSKPIWFTETGCPAADKGANQPNVFFDPKSSESHLPYYSNGQRDDLIQRLYGEALLEYWQVGGVNNPVSALYAGPMIDPANIQFWTWDARPFPDFPARSQIWSDGDNWTLGHWLNGRLGSSPLGEIVSDLCRSGDVTDFSVSGISGIVTGYVVQGGTSIRNALSPLAECYGFDVAERFGSLIFSAPALARLVDGLSPDKMAISKDHENAQISFGDAEQLPTGVRIQFSDDENAYQPAEAMVKIEHSDPDQMIAFGVSLVGGHADMKRLSHEILARARQQAKTLKISLPPSQLAVEVGDIISFHQDEVEGAWKVQRIEERGRRDIWLQGIDFIAPLSFSGSVPAISGQVQGPSRPALVVLDIPLLPGEPDRLGPRVMAYAAPWIGDVSIFVGADQHARAKIEQPAILGSVQQSVPPGGFVGRFDEGPGIFVRVSGADLLSITEKELFAGQNSMAVQHADLSWEIIQFQFADLQPDGSWYLHRLLRGQSGTQSALESDILEQAKLVLLDGSSLPASVNEYEIGNELSWKAVLENQSIFELEPAIYSELYVGKSRIPRKPVHLMAKHVSGDIQISWIRCTRMGGDNWNAFEVPLSESEERYSFKLFIDDTPVLSETLSTSKQTLNAAQLDQFFPTGLPDQLDIAVAQISPEAGSSPINRQLLSI